MSKKVIALVLLLVLGVAGVVGWWVFGKNRSATAKPTPTPKPAEKVNLIPVEERPYALIKPDAKKQGRGIVLTVGTLKKPAATGEYELEYQSGNLLQGAFGKIKIAELPQEYNILLGSCSAGGKCSYHENVTGGSLLLRFDQPEKYVLKNEWAFIENKDKATTFSSRDAKFVIEGKSLATVTHAAILQTPGLPAPVTKVSLSEAYAVGLISSARGPFTVSLRLKEDVQKATVLGWNGQDWVELKAKVTDRVAQATASIIYEAYLAVGESTTVKE